MSKDEQAIESEIQEKGLTAPRLSPAHIDDLIVAERYGRASSLDWDAAAPLPGHLSETALSCLTICVLVLKNGFTIIGKSACASPENYDAALGRKIAHQNAREQIWALEGYALRTKLAAA